MTISFCANKVANNVGNDIGKHAAKYATKMFPAFALVALLTLMLQSCATTTSMLDPEKPTVTLEQIKLLNLSFDKQKLELILNVENPNTFSLPLNTLIFAAKLAGEPIADGASRERVTIPANGSALLHVVVTTSISKLIGQIRSATNEGTNLDYNVKGKLKLDNWPKMIPFNSSGKIENPLL